jgi:hypothetical protein
VERPLTTEDQPLEQSGTQARLQQVVADVVAAVGGERDARLARERLAAAIEAAGLPEQPHKWVADTAAEIAAGRSVVVDRRQGTPPD